MLFRSLSMLLLCDERVPCVYIIVMGSVIYMFIKSIMTSQKKKKRKKLNYVDKMCEKGKRERERKRYINIMDGVYLKFFLSINVFFYFFRKSFNLLNLRSLIQLSEILSIELIGTHEYKRLNI